MDYLDAARAAADRYLASLRDPVTAERAARAALRNCRQAVEVVSARLLDDGYPRVRGVLPRAEARSIAYVAELLGRRPPRLLELFWEEVGGIELVDFEGYGHAAFFDEREIVPTTVDRTTDALVVAGLDEDWLRYLDGSLEAYREDVEDFEEDLQDAEMELDERDAPSFLIPLAPDHYHKDDISGGGPYGIMLGDDDWLPLFGGEFAWVGSKAPTLATATPDFLSYLRASILECGGFPALLGCPAFEPLRRMLTADLPVF